MNQVNKMLYNKLFGNNSKRLGLLYAALVVLAAFVLANSAFLFINSHFELSSNWLILGNTTKPYQHLLLLHLLSGLILGLLLIPFLVWHIKQSFGLFKNNPALLMTGMLSALSVFILLGTGLFLTVYSNNDTNTDIYFLHQISTISLIILFLFHRRLRLNQQLKPKLKQFLLASVLLGILFHLPHLSVFDQNQEHSLEASTDQEIEIFSPPSRAKTSSQLFPALVSTTSGDNYISADKIVGKAVVPENVLSAELETTGFLQSIEIGAQSCITCHADTVRQWAHSAHRFSSMNNPFYEATVTHMRENANETNEYIEEYKQKNKVSSKTGLIKSKWCASCHDPALLFTDKMEKTLDRTSYLSQAGLTCFACHLISSTHNITGNGNYVFNNQTVSPYPFSDSQGGFKETVKNFLIKASPEAHANSLTTPFFKTAQFCASCHKVSLNKPINSYRWIRGQNEYDSWHNSGIAHNASSTFYLPEKARKCQDCHMPQVPVKYGDMAAKNGLIRSHLFAAANTALPYIRGDYETVAAIEAFLKNRRLVVDFTSLISSQAHYIGPLTGTNIVLNRGKPYEVHVVVRNMNVGHAFPGGTIDSNESWLEVSLLDENGNTISINGVIDEAGHLETDVLAFKALFLDKNGEPVLKRNAQDIVTSVYKRVINPGSSEVGRYQFIIPASYTGKTITLSARLLWRKFNQDYVEFSYRTNKKGFKAFEQPPRLPITVIAESAVKINVTDDELEQITKTDSLQEEWVKINDYGIGLFLQNDNVTAIKAFKRVSELQPDRVDGYRNVARVLIREGRLDEAYLWLDKSLALKTDDPQTMWLVGEAKQKEGEYEEAIVAYSKVIEAFPEDRNALKNMGRAHFLLENYEEAIRYFKLVLDIDPEDLMSHYHLMQIYAELDEEQQMAKHESAYEYYRKDDNAKAVSRKFRANHPSSNYAAQSVRVYKVVNAKQVK
jgi:tetratricopeptide (TPR) repeat protein/RNase P subunit RPR2